MGGFFQPVRRAEKQDFFELLHLEEFVYVCLQSNDSETLAV